MVAKRESSPVARSKFSFWLSRFCSRSVAVLTGRELMRGVWTRRRSKSAVAETLR